MLMWHVVRKCLRLEITFTLVYDYEEVVVRHHTEQVILSPYQKGLSILAMKFSNPALAALPLPLVAFVQLVSHTKAASTEGLTIADGMVVELCEGSNITVANENKRLPALIVKGGASLTITGGSYKSTDGTAMYVYPGAVATVLGGMIEGGNRGDGMTVQQGVATVCDGTFQGRTGWYGVSVYWKAVVRVAGGMMIGGNNTITAGPGYGFFNDGGDATITGGTFKGGFNSTSGDQGPSLSLSSGNTSIYGGTYEGNWTCSGYSCVDVITKVYGKGLVVEGNRLMGTLCDGNPIDVNISGEPFTVHTENNCASFPMFDECGGKGGKSGKKTKGTLFRP
jgi:hypothetical protein